MVPLILKTNSMVPLFLMLWLAAVPPEKASLTLHTEPGTEIVWEGVSLGRANSDGLLIIQDVPPGTFTVTLKKGGFHELTTDIEVIQGEAELVLELEAIPKVPPKVPPRKPPPQAESLNERKEAVPDKTPPVAERTPVEKAPPESPPPVAERTPVEKAPPESPLPAEETEKSGAEGVSDPAPRSGAGYYLLAAVVIMGAGIYGLKRFRSRRVLAGPDPHVRPSPRPGRPALPGPEPAESAPFLEELKAREKVLVLTSSNLCRFYLPGRGLGYSFLIHGIVLTVVQLLPFLSVVDSLTEEFPPGQGAMGSGVRMVMYLPSIGGGGQGEGGGSESSGNEPPAAPSSGAEGLVYPGPQVIRSDSPLPNNRYQTLLQPDLEDLPILEGRLDLPNFLSMPEVPDTVKPEEEQPADPSEGVATEPVQAELEDLPISKRRLDVANLFLMPEVPDVDPSDGVTEPVQAELADLPFLKRRLDVANLLSMLDLPDTVKLEEQQPVDPSDGVTEPVQAELADLPFLKRRLDVPNLLSMLDLPDTVKLEEQQPVDPSDGVTEPVQAELADLPFLKRRLDVPNLLSMLDLPDTVKPEEQQPVDPSDGVTEPVRARMHSRLQWSTSRLERV